MTRRSEHICPGNGRARSGLLHSSQRCAGSGFVFTLHEGMELLGFLYLDYRGFCRRCLAPR